MTPTFIGRIQTRIFVVAVIGSLWTLIVTPLITPLAGAGVTAGDLYPVTFTALLWVGILGVVVWEPVYHLLQQYRWEKDWPAFFGLITGVNEGLVVGLVLAGPLDRGLGPLAGAFLAHFVSTWLVLWVWVNGPMRVPFLRWRYDGGRII